MAEEPAKVPELPEPAEVPEPSISTRPQDSCGGEASPESSSASGSESTRTWALICGASWLLILGVTWGAYLRQLHTEEVLPHGARRVFSSAADKPRSDARDYASTTLPNGLEVLAVHDPRARLGALSMGVQAGSYDDPQDMPGLMHFIEHMLFMGSKSFPVPGEFDDFVNQNGGEMNAFTASEQTVYFYEFANTKLREGMDRFSDFFRAPLFREEVALQEVQNIASEHAKNVQDPSHREEAVLQQLADPKSHFSRFSTGDLNTLVKIPQKRGVNISNALKAQFQHFYCPHKMKLVTFSPSSLKQQLEDIHDTFGTIIGDAGCNQRPPSKFSQPVPFTPDRLGKWVLMQSTTRFSSLILVFPMPEDMRKKYASKPFDYVGWVLGDYHGQGSLLSVLRDKLALAYEISSNNDMSSAGTNYFMELTLTPQGRNNIELIMDVIFAYLASLRWRGVDKALAQSLASVSELSFNWQEPSAPMSTASKLAALMSDGSYPTSDILWADVLNKNPDVKEVEAIFRRLVPSGMNVLFSSPDAKNVSGFQENQQDVPYYGVKYVTRSFDEEFPGATARWDSWLKTADASGTEATFEEMIMKRAEKVPSLVSVDEADPALKTIGVPSERNKPLLPKQSGSLTGLPSEASLQHPQAEKPGPLSLIAQTNTEDERLYGQEPRLLWVETQTAGDSSVGHSLAQEPELWYRKGWTSNAPISSPRFSLTTSFRQRVLKDRPEVSAEENVRMLVYNRLLGEEMEPEVADLHGGQFSIDVGVLGLSIDFGGFQPTLPRYLEKVLSEFQKHAGLPAAGPRFERVTELYRQELETYSEMPIEFAISYRNMILSRGEYSRLERLEALKRVTLDNAQTAMKDITLSRPLELTALSMGNLDSTQATSATRAVIETVSSLGLNTATDGEVHRVARVVNPAGPIEIRARNPRGGDINSAIVVTILNDVATVESRVLFGILGRMFGDTAYGTLRSKMSLGYIVNGGRGDLSNVDEITCLVQGYTKGPDEMESAVHMVFMKTFVERLQDMKADEFQWYWNSFRDSITELPIKTAQETNHFWAPIHSSSVCFSLHEAMLKYMNETVTSKEVLINAWRRFVMPAEGTRKMVVVKLFPESMPLERPTEEAAVKNWTSRGLSAESIALLRREYQKTQVLDRADSVTRAQVLAHGGAYFPTDLKCGPAPRRGVDAEGKAEVPSQEGTALAEESAKETDEDAVDVRAGRTGRHPRSSDFLRPGSG